MAEQRVQEVLQRMQTNLSNVENLKTCCGILAILSRDESNKLQIARDGTRLVVAVMETHLGHADLLEAACDLLWSLAFNNSLVKDMIGRIGAVPVMIRGMRMHLGVPEVLKSACGALSNLCQVSHNQALIAANGGTKCLVLCLSSHLGNAALLPFILDALASLVVGNEHVAHDVSGSGVIATILGVMQKHTSKGDLVKSACHTLAILSDTKGQGAEIASAGGVRALLRSLAQHPLNVDLHRVAAVVLLRMLQEAPVAREMAGDGGIQLMLTILSGQLNDGETAAAVSYILYAITHADVLQGPPPLELNGGSGGCGVVEKEQVACILRVLDRYAERKDIVRACSRCLVNLSRHAPVAEAINDHAGLDTILRCVTANPNAKDVSTCAVVLLKEVAKRQHPSLYLPLSVKNAPGLLLCVKAKPHDYIAVAVVFNTVARTLRHAPAAAVCVGVSDWETRSIADLLNWVKVLAAKMDGKVLDPEQEAAFAAVIGLLRVLIERHGTVIKGLADISALMQPLPGLLSVDSPVQVGLHLLLNAVDGSSESLSSRGHTSMPAPLPPEEEPGAAPVSRSLVTSPSSSSRRGPSRSADAAASLGSEVSKEDTLLRLRASKAQATTPDMAVAQAQSPSSTTDHNHSQRSQPAASFLHPNQERAMPSLLLTTPPPYLEPISRPSRESMSFAGLRTFPQDTSSSSPTSVSSSRSTPPSSVGGCKQVVYEGTSAGGVGIESKVPVPEPYTVDDGLVGTPFTHSLRFNADFESGNLLRAVQRGETEYDLFLRADLHTHGCTQWFYFAITDTHPPSLVEVHKQKKTRISRRITFNVVNLTKPESLFNQGMRPVLYSYHDAELLNIGWVRTGTDIQYRANEYTRQAPADGNSGALVTFPYYTLTFTIEFYNPGDTYLLAHSYPFTYSDHKAHLAFLMAPTAPSRRFIRRSVLCTTLGNNECDLLTVTDFGQGEEDDPRQARKKRVVLSGRVHPGETPASWMMKGILDFLTSDCREAALLRSMFMFKIIPILNPDGVICGNNRCSLAGVDLNRQWKRPSKLLHPTIFHTKMLIRSERLAQREVFMYVDLHGHSRKMNVFMYGCDEKKSKPKPAVRVFPRLLSWNRLGQKYVSFKDCSFHVKKNRETTARVVVARELGVRNSYTLEATFCGADFGVLRNYHFNTQHLEEAGKGLCDALIDYLYPNPAQRETTLSHPNLSIPEEPRLLSEEELDEKAAAEVPLDGGLEGDDLSSESDEEEAHGSGDRQADKEGANGFAASHLTSALAAGRRGGSLQRESRGASVGESSALLQPARSAIFQHLMRIEDPVLRTGVRPSKQDIGLVLSPARSGSGGLTGSKPRSYMRTRQASVPYGVRARRLPVEDRFAASSLSCSSLHKLEQEQSVSQQVEPSFNSSSDPPPPTSQVMTSTRPQAQLLRYPNIRVQAEERAQSGSPIHVPTNKVSTVNVTTSDNAPSTGMRKNGRGMFAPPRSLSMHVFNRMSNQR